MSESGRTTAVFGRSPLAAAVARHAAAEGPTALIGDVQYDGPFLWRHAHLGTGEGVKSSVKGADRAILVLDDGGATEALGAFLVLKSAQLGPGAVVWDRGVPAPAIPQELTDWSRIEVGPVLPPEDEMVRRWIAAFTRRGRVWIVDPGPAPFVDAEAAAAAIASAPAGARWRLCAPEVQRVADVAAAYARDHDAPLMPRTAPGAFARWRAGYDPARGRRWVASPPGAWEGPGIGPLADERQ